MFERFTDQARRVVVLAQDEARMLGHNYIGTEHILLGLLSEGEGPAAQALGSLEVSLDAARQQVEEIIGKGTGQPGGHIPFTPRAKKVLELSLREAMDLGDNYIGTEHILLGLVREGDGVGAQVLVRLGADLPDVRARVLETVQAAPAEGVRRVPATAQMMGSRIQLEQMTGRMGEVLSRLDEISRRLAAIESLLAEMRGQRPPRSRKPPAGGEAGSTGQAGPTAGPGQPEPPAAQA
jgi:ATP-dependent Clp protease ATP-binding subunit ClpC